MPQSQPAADIAHGEIFLDARGPARALRLTWHPEAEIVVMSLWRDGSCAGTFRLGRDDVGPFVDALVDGLRETSGEQPPVPKRGRHRNPRLPATPDRSASQRAPVTRAGDRGSRAYGDQSPAEPETGDSFFDWVFTDDEAERSASAR